MVETPGPADRPARQRAADGRFVRRVAPPETPETLELYLLRHADAGDSMAWPGDDADRPLSKKGRRQSKRLGRHLRAVGLAPDAVLTSPKVRAAQTAKAIGKAMGADVMTDERLGGGFDPGALAELVRQLGPAVHRVVLVGHDPDFSDLASFLVGTQVWLAKGAVVRIDFLDRAIGASAGSLRWLLPPDAVAG